MLFNTTFNNISEKFEDTKGVIRIRKSKKDSQRKDQNKGSGLTK